MKKCFAIFILVFSISTFSQEILSSRYLILNEPVRVEAELLDFSAPVYSFTISISYKQDQYEVDSGIYFEGNPQQLPEEVKKLAGWKNGYLFIFDGCGGGNAWCCDMEKVFAIRDNKLKNLGDVCLHFAKSEYKPGASLEDGYFIDVNAALENISCHACSPDLKVILKEENESLLPVEELTWKANLKRFKKNMKIVRKWYYSEKRENLLEVGDGIYFIALASKFCDKEKIYKKVQLYAREWFKEETYSNFLDVMNTVTSIKEIRKGEK